MFKKYNSIENTYQKRFIERIQSHGYWKEEYVVQEKVHGANMSIITQDGQNFFAAKRTALLDAEENFNNYQKVLADLNEKLVQLWKLVQADYPELEQLTVFGEIFGGSYAHPEVKRDANAVRVQKGVFYSPSNHFYAFDILINTEKYLDVDRANALFEKVGLLYAKTLFRGSLEDCLKYPNDFNSHIPMELGLPEIEDNTSEGSVIKPVKTLFMHSGSRLILKNKNEKFAERMKVKKRPVSQKQENIPEHIQALRDQITAYVTENRLDNVLSKIGEVSMRDFGKILGMLNKDIVEDFSKDFAEELAPLEKKEVKLITKFIGKKTPGLVREKLMTIT